MSAESNAFGFGRGGTFYTAPGNARGARSAAGLIPWKTDGIKIAEYLYDCVEWDDDQKRAIINYHPDAAFPGVLDASGLFPRLYGDNNWVYTPTLADFAVGDYVEFYAGNPIPGVTTNPTITLLHGGEMYPDSSSLIGFGSGTITAISDPTVTIDTGLVDPVLYDTLPAGNVWLSSTVFIRNGNYLIEGSRINADWWASTDASVIRRDFGGRTGFYFNSGPFGQSQWIRGYFAYDPEADEPCVWQPLDPNLRTAFQLEVFYPDNGDDVEVRVYGILRGLDNRDPGGFISSGATEYVGYVKVFDGSFDPATNWPDPVAGPLTSIAVSNTLACSGVGGAFDFGFPDGYFPNAYGDVSIRRLFSDRIAGADGTVTLYPIGTTVTLTPAVAELCTVTLPDCNNGCGDPPEWEDGYLFYRAKRCGVAETGKHVYVRLPEETDIYAIRWRGCREIIRPGRETFPPDAILALNWTGPKTSATPVDGCTLYNPDTECPATFTLTRCDDAEVSFVTTSPLYDFEGEIVRLTYQAERGWNVTAGGAGNDRAAEVLEVLAECPDDGDDPAPDTCPDGLPTTYLCDFEYSSGCSACSAAGERIGVLLTRGTGCTWTGSISDGGGFCSILLELYTGLGAADPFTAPYWRITISGCITFGKQTGATPAGDYTPNTSATHGVYARIY